MGGGHIYVYAYLDMRSIKRREGPCRRIVGRHVRHRLMTCSIPSLPHHPPPPPQTPKRHSVDDAYIGLSS